MTLEHEDEVYKAHLIDLLGVNDMNEGKFAVVKGDEIRGGFETFDDALTFGYDRHGLVPFLVKKIERTQTVLYFSRDL